MLGGDVNVPVERWVQLLKSQPTLDELRVTVSEIEVARGNFSRAQEMQLVNALLQFTIIEAYSELKYETKALICNILTSVIGLGNLVARTEAVESGSASIYLQLLDVILQTKVQPFSINEFSESTRLFLSLIMLKCRSRSEVKEVERLLMKGVLWGSVAKRILSKSLDVNFESTSPLANREAYIQYLCYQMVSYYEYNKDSKELMENLCSMVTSLSLFSSDSEELYEFFFCSEHWPMFVDIYNKMKPSDRRRHLWKIILVSSKNKKASLSQEYATAVILNELIIAPYLDSTIQNEVIYLNNDHLTNIVALLISKGGFTMLNRAIRSQISQFADPVSIKREPMSQQRSRTYFIGALFTHAPKEYIQNYLRDQGFLLGVSNRLSSFSSTSKALAVVLADYACQLCGQDKIFKIEDLDGLELMFSNLDSSHKFPDPKDAWSILSEPIIEEPKEKVYQAPQMVVQKTEIDSDDESDDDDPTIGPRKRIPKPIYIKDILNYLNVDTEDSTCFEKRQMALTFAPTLIRQKSSFGSEVSFYAEELLKHLIALTNHFEEKDFESKRLNCLISVISASPSSAVYAVDLLASGDYSLLQRIALLSSLSLSARDLKGFKDTVVENSYELKSFPSKQLPRSIHSAYMALEDQLNSRSSSTTSIERQLQDSLMDDVSSNFKELSVGKVLRVLRRLTKKQEPKDKPVAEFATIIGKYFFFPLVKTWHEVGEIDIGHYTPLLVAHYIKTLSLILHCAYPTASNLSDMIKEYLIILSSLLMRIGTDEVQVVESVATGFLLVFDITDEENLVTSHGDVLALLQTWLSSSWDSIVDEKAKSLCAGLLLRLNSILEKNQRLLMDQINSLY